MAAWEPLLDFDDIEHEMMLEDITPAYEALVRWCGRYPQYSKEIADSIVDDAVSNLELGEPQGENARSPGRSLARHPGRFTETDVVRHLG
jgi:hypothetical protein